MPDESRDNRNKVIEEAYRLSELRLEMQVNASLASDQRAINLAGVLMAAAAIIAGWALGKDTGTAVALSIAAVLMTIAAASAWAAARPREYRFPGNSFAHLQEDIDENVDYHELLKVLGGFNDKSVRLNRKDAKIGVVWITVSVCFAATSIGVAVIGVWV